jgi:hypothetical protein
MRPAGLFLAALLLLVPPGSPAQELTERATFKGHKFRIGRAALRSGFRTVKFLSAEVSALRFPGF